MNYKHIDKDYFIEIFKQNDWYIEIEEFINKYFFAKREVANESSNSDDSKKLLEEFTATRNEFLNLIVECLDKNIIKLGEKKLNLDKDRILPVDTIVIHHSSRHPDEDYRISTEALGLIRLYIPVFSKKDTKLYGKPISSDHFYQKKLTFSGYHYLVFTDGKFIKLLDDKSLGWHCGNYEINKRSIAVCFHDELENKKPTKEALNSAHKIISQYGKYIKILGHREVVNYTECPGDLFLGEKGWKDELF